MTTSRFDNCQIFHNYQMKQSCGISSSNLALFVYMVYIRDIDTPRCNNDIYYMYSTDL